MALGAASLALLAAAAEAFVAPPSARALRTRALGQSRGSVSSGSASLLPPAAAEEALYESLRQAAVFARMAREGEVWTEPVTDLALRQVCKDGKLSERTAARLQQSIEDIAAELERSQPTLNLAAENDQRLADIDGTWKLLYSNASEITNLNRLPLGFKLKTVYQRVDLKAGALENRAEVRHKWRLATQRTRVVARAWTDELGAVSRAGVKNVGNRLAVQFTKVVISLRRILFLPTPFIRIVARPNGTLEKVRLRFYIRIPVYVQACAGDFEVVSWNSGGPCSYP